MDILDMLWIFLSGNKFYMLPMNYSEIKNFRNSHFVRIHLLIFKNYNISKLNAKVGKEHRESEIKIFQALKFMSRQFCGNILFLR